MTDSSDRPTPPPVLVVDDDPISRSLLAALVEAAGHPVREAADGESALTEIASGRPRIVLVDCEMPGMSGLTLCHHARRLPLERPPHLAMVTVHRTKEKLVEAFEAGVDDFLSKPVHEEELILRLRAWSRLVGLQDQLFEKHRLLEAQNQKLGAANARLNDLATRDALTGLPNRRAAVTRLHDAWADASAPLSVAMIDVDRFKSVNDGLGHGAGDALLRHLGQVFRSEARPGDGVFRLGGDEFLLLFPGQDAPAAEACICRCLAALASRHCRHGSETIPATISAGVAARAPGHAVPVDLLELADARLYAAKAGGRDGVRAA